MAGVKLKGVVTGRYLFGAPMAGRDVRWTYTRARLATVPATVTDAFPLDRYVFLDEEHEDFIFDLLSTNLDRKYRGMPKEAAYAVKFTDLISARLEE